MSGYRLALKEAVKFIKANLCVPVETLGDTHLINAAKTAISSKILGPEVSHYYCYCVSVVGKSYFFEKMYLHYLRCFDTK